MASDRRRAQALTEEQIKARADITQQDVDDARAWWRSHAPAQYKELLDAEEKPEE